MLTALLQGISFGLAPLLSIGPFKIFVFSQALQRGWRRSIHLALVPLIADIPLILLLWLLIRALPPLSVDLLRLVGGGFYLYLAYRIVKGARREGGREALETAPRRTFLQAITAVWVTPAAYINWSTIGVPAILRYGEQSAGQLAAFLVGFYILWVGGLTLQIYVVGAAGNLNRRANLLLVYAAAALLVWFGVYQFWIGIQNLL
jgi:threonine/homoserine/homoserine lactone efflux protein